MAAPQVQPIPPVTTAPHRPYPALFQPAGYGYQYHQPPAPHQWPPPPSAASSSPWAALFSQRVGTAPATHSAAPPLIAPSSFTAQHSAAPAANNYPRHLPTAPHADRQRHIQQQQQHIHTTAPHQQQHSHYSQHNQHNQHRHTNQRQQRNNNQISTPQPQHTNTSHTPTTLPTNHTDTHDTEPAQQRVKKRKQTHDEVDDIIAHYADKIGGDDPDSIQRWKEERRSSFPTRDNVKRREEEKRERRERGEIGELEGRSEMERAGRGRGGGRGGKRGRGGGQDGGRGRGRGRGWSDRGRGGRGGWKGGRGSDRQKDEQMEEDVHDVERQETSAVASQSTALRAADEHKEQSTDNMTTASAHTSMLDAASAAAGSLSSNATPAASATLSTQHPSSSSSSPAAINVSIDDNNDSPPLSLPLTLDPAQLERIQQQQQAEDARRLTQQQQRNQQREAVEAEREWRQQRVNVCRYYVNNECKRGDECEWPHDEEARRDVLLRRQMNEARGVEGRGRGGRGRSRGGDGGGGGGGGVLRQAQASNELLSDLLRDERRKESSVILQCVRYIVKNNFLQPVTAAVDGSSGERAEAVVGEQAGELERGGVDLIDSGNEFEEKSAVEASEADTDTGTVDKTEADQ